MPGQSAQLARLDSELAEVAALVRDAHFRTAVGVAESTREWADEIPSSPEVREARSRLLVLLATAQIALDEKASALASMERAVTIWPLLKVDPETRSPKVVTLFETVRAERAWSSRR